MMHLPSDIRPVSPLLAVELGGTKCICLAGTGPADIRGRIQIPTTTPEETLGRIEEALQQLQAQTPSTALGIASFGPLDLTRSSARYGQILSTPKPGWSHTDVAGRLGRHVKLPVAFNTDVNGAALAEARWGAGQGLSSLVYITVGTGIGAGVLVGGRPLQGFSHPELGHVRVARAAGDAWPGSCPYHGDCVEGLASGPAIAARTGKPAQELPPEHPVWDSVAFALGQLLHTLVLAMAPQRILLGGGVMQARPGLFPRIRQTLATSLRGYIEAKEIQEELDTYVVPPALGDLAGPLGALALAAEVR